ncbi:neutral zinc metallopeptidase [soil metagenome]
MRWEGRRGSRNVEDRRGMGGKVAGGGVGVVIIALVVMLLGGDPGAVLDGGGGAGGPVAGPAEPRSEAEDSLARMVSVVLADTEEVWDEVFRQEVGSSYEPARLVLFTGTTQSGCGFAQSAMGPFYCPLDRSVYIDLAFYDDLRRMGAPGDLAQAYVIAHEVGHHIQTLLGISQRVHEQRRRLSEGEGNALSVRQELQADCFAGVWASRADQMWNILEPGQVSEALDAAAAVGDDRLQQAGRGVAVPESFTHGTSEQRMRWFMRGFQSGQAGECDTFAAANI